LDVVFVIIVGGLMILPFSTLPRQAFPGAILLVVGFMLFWTFITLTWEMAKEVDRLAPSKSLIQSVDQRRTWREHQRLFPKSRLRNIARWIVTLAVSSVLCGIVWMLSSGRQ
jgi:hypothetical protein